MMAQEGFPFCIATERGGSGCKGKTVLIGCFKEQHWWEKPMQVCQVCSQMLGNLIKKGQTLDNVMRCGHLLNQLWMS